MVQFSRMAKFSIPSDVGEHIANIVYPYSMGSERSSTVRQIRSGQICALCRASLPAPHTMSEQLGMYPTKSRFGRRTAGDILPAPLATVREVALPGLQVVEHEGQY